ncbi:type II toxin-antitoxin system VapC family toxin [Brachybacterium squillarum]|uniref:type II toxin-antitoxin system VapC family toxin n=1 Tax=Brachybacterium squillarum TaxID=661979 RepID=UPI000262A40C|nr:type II toxin-antitoxin system VapC family toxin [Brachybacterium squillarum]
MSHLLDTNVISELRKPAGRASDQVRDWVRGQLASTLFLSAIMILEIDLGIRRRRRRDPEQADLLQRWLEGGVLATFDGRILRVDVAVTRRAAALHVPDPRPERDALIGATALVPDLTVVTRNVSDFCTIGVEIRDPWSSS